MGARGSIPFSNAEFIRRAEERWPGLFDYSKTNYKSKREKVLIICRNHSLDYGPEEILVWPSVFISHKEYSAGCKYCSKEQAVKERTSRFIQEAEKRFPGRYDYSKTQLKTSRSKPIVICNHHSQLEGSSSEVLVVPANFLKSGCPICNSSHLIPANGVKRSNTRISFEDFITKAHKKYNHKYDYLPDSWTSQSDLVGYYCPLHGYKEQVAYDHIQNRSNNTGCDECGRLQANKSESLDFDAFAHRASQIHGGEYTYLYSTYTNRKNPTAIICPKYNHGPFVQIASYHLQGGKCPLCVGSLNTKNYITRAKQVHKGFYSYERLEFKSLDVPVVITCPIHGDWLASTMGHLYGKSGCPRCGYASSRRDCLPVFHEDPEWAESYCEIYITSLRGYPDLLKVGISKNPKTRDSKYINIESVAGTRAQCWCVEQQVLISNSKLLISKFPDELLSWDGRYELLDASRFDRVASLSDINQEMLKTSQLGWKKYVESNLIPRMGRGWNRK